MNDLAQLVVFDLDERRYALPLATIREVTKSTLELYGYRVATADDGTEALAAFAQARTDIAAVITDLAMPFLDGVSTIRALRNMQPDLKIIAVSGRMQEAKLAELGDAAKNVSFLQKPFTADILLTRLHEVLTGQPLSGDSENAAHK